LKNRRPKFFYGYVVVGVAVCALVVYWGTFYTFGVFFKPVSTAFGWTRATTSAAFSINALVWGITEVVAGKLSDRFGPRAIVTAGGLFIGLGYLLMSQISGALWQLYLFYGVIVAIGMGCAFVPIVSTVAKWFVKRRGLMTGIVVSGIGIGTMLIPPLATRLIDTYDWSLSYMIVGAIALVFITLAAQFLRRDPAQMAQLPDGADELETENTAANGAGSSLREAIRTRQFWMLSALFFSFFFCLNTIMVHIVNHATDLPTSPRILETTAANILVIIGGTSIAGRLAMGAFADRIGIRLTVIITLAVVTVALFWLLWANELWMLYLFGVIFGFGYGGLVALTSPLAANLFGLGSHGVILGITFFVGALGQSLGPFLAGKIFDATTSYQPAFIICGVLAIICIILALLLRPTTGKGGANETRRST